MVIWDRVHQRMVLGRDCFGVRGLYVYRDENWIAVSDEVGNLLNLPFANTPKIGMISSRARAKLATSRSMARGRIGSRVRVCRRKSFDAVIFSL